MQQFVEQDYNIQRSGDELPTYDELAVQGGPNSRFGRWREWIEKRAAERYQDITPEERSRRRQRGWGNNEMNHYYNGPDNTSTHSRDLSVPSIDGLSISAESNTSSYYPPSDTTTLLPQPPPPIPAVSQKLRPAHLQLCNFGSRFLPHTTSQIHCVLPLMSGKLLLIGHDEGLSVMDMYPQSISESGVISFGGPDDATTRLLWTGEGVFQMDLLEEGEGGDTKNGVVLCLVGPQADSPTHNKESESLRSVRMYKLSSLTSLARWAISQKGQPVDVRRLTDHTSHQQSPPRRHKPQVSIARGIKDLIHSPGGGGNHSPDHASSSSTYQALLSPSPSVSSTTSVFKNGRSKSPARTESTDSWDMMDDLPLRWATDFVPLATANSRLLNTSVISYTLYNGDDPRSRQKRKLLAIATKSNIILYETPRGERAFRFVKEFYTPLQSRNITFFQQLVQETVRHNSEPTTTHKYGNHRRTESTTGLRAPESPTSVINYGSQISLFVIFEKKVGWIRLTDSAVGEMEFYDDGSSTPYGSGPHYREPSIGSGSLNGTLRKSKLTIGHVEIPNHLGKWTLPIQVEIPVPPSRSHPAGSKLMYLLTRGHQTQILPCPLPTPSIPPIPIHIINWRSAPSSVVARTLIPSSPEEGFESYLQLIGLGENGVEVQELSVPSIGAGGGKGKGKASGDDTVWADADAGGDTGFLASGGHWDHPFFSPLQVGALSRSGTMSSTTSGYSVESMTTTEMITQRKREQGVYAWCRRGLEDWRVFWLGGTLRPDFEPDEAI